MSHLSASSSSSLLCCSSSSPRRRNSCSSSTNNSLNSSSTLPSQQEKAVMMEYYSTAQDNKEVSGAGISLANQEDEDALLVTGPNIPGDYSRSSSFEDDASDDDNNDKKQPIAVAPNVDTFGGEKGPAHPHWQEEKLTNSETMRTNNHLLPRNQTRVPSTESDVSPTWDEIRSTRWCFSVRNFITRVSHWKVDLNIPTESEIRLLNSEQVDSNKLLRSYMVWRKTALYIAIPFLLLAFIVRLYRFMDNVQDGFSFRAFQTSEKQFVTKVERYSNFGMFAILSRDIVPTLLWLGGCVLSVFTWVEVTLSVQILYFALIISQTFYLWPLIFQTKFFLDLDDENFGEDTAGFEEGLFHAGIAAGSLSKILVSQHIIL